MKSLAADVSFRDRHLVVTLNAAHSGSSQSLRYNLTRFKPFTDMVSEAGVLDFLELMLALYALDRIVPREQTWSRKIKIRFPVLKSRSSRWSSVVRDVENLCFLSTGDEISIDLTERDAPVHPDFVALPFALRNDVPPTVSLFSCGLDSLAGVARLMSELPGPHLLVSVIANSNKIARFDAIRHDLERCYGDHRVETLRLGSFLDYSHETQHKPQEKTQRFRTLLAITAGLTAAAMVGAKSLHVHENGIGLLNLPLPLVQLAHESSQALFPANVALWRLVTEALLGGIVIEYDNRFRTKGEMLARLPADLRRTIGLTTSCDAPPRISRCADCGLCGSCVFRRLALSVAGLRSFDTRYSWTAPSDNIDREATLKRHAELMQSWLARPEPWKEFCIHQPTLLRFDAETTNPKERYALKQSTLELLTKHCGQTLAWRTDHAA